MSARPSLPAAAVRPMPTEPESPNPLWPLLVILAALLLYLIVRCAAPLLPWR